MAVVCAACLAGTAVTATVEDPSPHASRSATAIILLAGAASLLLLVLAALICRFGSTRASVASARRTVWTALGVLGLGVAGGIATAIGIGIGRGSPAPPLIFLWTAAMVCLPVLFLHRRIRRALPDPGLDPRG